jgi:transposase
MRGEQRGSEGLFSYIRLEGRIAADHPLRAIRALVNEVLSGLSRRFEELYSHTGRPSIAPEYCCGQRCCRRSSRYARSGS